MKPQCGRHVSGKASSLEVGGYPSSVSDALTGKLVDRRAAACLVAWVFTVRFDGGRCLRKTGFIE
jgi:hypothetical protein